MTVLTFKNMAKGSIDFHLKRIKAIQKGTQAVNDGFVKEQGNLMARVFLRNTGALNNHKCGYIIQEQDILAWFENLDYLKSYTEYDTL